MSHEEFEQACKAQVDEAVARANLDDARTEFYKEAKSLCSILSLYLILGWVLLAMALGTATILLIANHR